MVYDNDNLNPISNLYKEIEKIIKTIVIKYASKAEAYETLETKQHADGYIAAKEERDTFMSYGDYLKDDYEAVGIYDYDIISKALAGDISIVPNEFREDLLKIRRQREISNFEEQNDYYRLLAGYPPINTLKEKYHYLPKDVAKAIGVDETIPIHRIQDYYNDSVSTGLGDYYIQLVESYGIIQNLKKNFPDEEYLNYIGKNRISIMVSRRAKNFQILKLDRTPIRTIIYDQFVRIYEQCRTYFMTSIYVREYRGFFDYYDNFIGLCIMVMTIQQMVMRQISLSIEREFFDIYAVQMLYEAYNVPYDLKIDEETQRQLLQSLNCLILEKSTNKVIYDIAHILGFSNIEVYKYYLARERKYDIYGVPVVAEKEQFNVDTGEVEVLPDYDKMYDVHFQKCELGNDDFVTTFNSESNRVEYEDIVPNDAYWWEDQNLKNRVWDVAYNFVETKYLGLGISYRLTDLVYENILLLKFLISKADEIDTLSIYLPKIIMDVSVPLFDAVILLICLTARQHHLKGEIISIPTQVISVLDYLHNVDGSDDKLVDTFSFDFDYFTTQEGKDQIHEVYMELGEEDGAEFLKYISVLSINSNASNAEKIYALNEMFDNIKNLSEFLSYHMARTKSRRTYEALKTFYNAAFYAKEVRSVFTIVGEKTGYIRTAKNFFEYLYYRNQKLYEAVFKVDKEAQYAKYLEDNNLSMDDFPISEFYRLAEIGEIDIAYDEITNVALDDVVYDKEDDLIYYYVNHIISQMSSIIRDLNMLYFSNGTATPLENLMVKLVRFFKSHTVDMIGLDTIIICDMRNDNLLRLFDEVNYIEKTIIPKDNMNISYSDVVHRIQTEMELNDTLKFKEREFHNKDLIIDKKVENGVQLKDKIKKMWYSD